MPKTSINLTHNPVSLPKLCKNLPILEKIASKLWQKFFNIHTLLNLNQNWEQFKFWVKLRHEIVAKTENFVLVYTRDVCLFWLLRHKLWFDKKRRAKIPSFRKLKNFSNFLDWFLCLGRTRNWWNLWRGFSSGRRRRPWRRRLGNRGEILREKSAKILWKWQYLDEILTKFFWQIFQDDDEDDEDLEEEEDPNQRFLLCNDSEAVSGGKNFGKIF